LHWQQFMQHSLQCLVDCSSSTATWQQHRAGEPCSRAHRAGEPCGRAPLLLPAAACKQRSVVLTRHSTVEMGSAHGGAVFAGRCCPHEHEHDHAVCCPAAFALVVAVLSLDHLLRRYTLCLMVCGAELRWVRWPLVSLLTIEKPFVKPESAQVVAWDVACGCWLGIIAMLANTVQQCSPLLPHRMADGVAAMAQLVTW
jgi:hypothetical protein